MASNLTQEDLREIYLQDLTKMVTYGGKTRSRVRYPQKWRDVVSPSNTLLLEQKHIGKTWVWSDLHFGHKNIINFSDRPFPDVPTMNEYLVANFNDYVGEDDISIWVGDVAFMNDTKANELLDQCNGYKILVVGNHDFDHKRLKNLNFDEVHLLYLLEHPDVDLVFTHYPIEQGLPLPYINVHGHIHAGPHTFETPQHINVCCEFHQYKPIELETIIRWAKTRVESTDNVSPN